jgi:hypothetical protein
MTKYHARKVVIDGFTFDSQAEGRRYSELLLLCKAGEITNLVPHPVYPLVVNGQKIGAYIADFTYLTGTGRVVEDVKGVKTPVYRLKRKLVKALYGIDIVEVTE